MFTTTENSHVNNRLKLQKLNVTLMNNGNLPHCYCKISVPSNCELFRDKISSSAKLNCMTVKNLQLELSLRVPEKYCGRKFQYFEFCGFLYFNCIPMYIVTEKAYPSITSDSEIS